MGFTIVVLLSIGVIIQKPGLSNPSKHQAGFGGSAPAQPVRQLERSAKDIEAQSINVEASSSSLEKETEVLEPNNVEGLVVEALGEPEILNPKPARYGRRLKDGKIFPSRFSGTPRVRNTKRTHSLEDLPRLDSKGFPIESPVRRPETKRIRESNWRNPET